MQKYLILFIAFFLLNACISKNSKNSEKFNSDLIELSMENFVAQNPIETCQDKIKVLPLQTDTNCLMGYIQKIEILDSTIFILDVNHTLFVYKMDGSFVYKVSATGRGPKEISRLGGFYINGHKKYVGIWDNLKFKMFKYDYQGKLLDIVDCGNKLFYAAKEIKMIDKNRLLLTLSYDPGITSSYVSINCSDYTVDKKYFLYPYRWKTSSSGFNNLMQARNNAGHYVVNMLSDTVYQYVNENFIPRFVLKSHKNKTLKNKLDHVTDYSDIVSYTQSRNISPGLMSIAMTDSICCVEYRCNQEWNYVFWNLYTYRGAYTSSSYRDRLNVFKNFDIKATTGPYFVGFVLPCNLDLKKIAEKCSLEVVNILSVVKEEDNPVLVFYPIYV